jgi:hypothetical protein
MMHVRKAKIRIGIGAWGALTLCSCTVFGRSANNRGFIVLGDSSAVYLELADTAAVIFEVRSRSVPGVVRDRAVAQMREIGRETECIRYFRRNEFIVVLAHDGCKDSGEVEDGSAIAIYGVTGLPLMPVHVNPTGFSRAVVPLKRRP